MVQQIAQLDTRFTRLQIRPKAIIESLICVPLGPRRFPNLVDSQGNCSVFIMDCIGIETRILYDIPHICHSGRTADLVGEFEHVDARVVDGLCIAVNKLSVQLLVSCLASTKTSTTNAVQYADRNRCKDLQYRLL